MNRVDGGWAESLESLSFKVDKDDGEKISGLE